jgi:cation diffusion facilitator CzcD-associated flavoprotein CzcO
MARKDISVAVIGGGFGGIAAAHRLKKAGITDFVVFERSSSIGGTWWDNHYPGAETDAQSHLYCFSFAPYRWKSTHSSGSEVREYLDYVVDKFDLRSHFRFNTSVSSVVWEEASQSQVVTTGDGTEQRFTAVISAVGIFVSVNLPDLPGLGEFRGQVAHTALWDDSLDLTGKRVAVMGTGSSASQVVPTIADQVQSVHLFQRQPAWLLPKNNHDFSRREKALYRIPGVWKVRRAYLYLRQDLREIGGQLFRPDSKVNRQARERALANIDRVFADRPDLAKAVTPTYAFGGKRALLSSEYYESLLHPSVELIPHAISHCTQTAVVDATGASREVDVLVLATGFVATGYLSSLDVIGRDGAKLHSEWNGEPYAFLGLTVPKFPNFFMLYGPNTNGGLIVSNTQRQAAYAVSEICRLGRGGVTAIEVRPDVTRWYNAFVQRLIARTSFKATDNYFQTASGKVVTQWPDGASTYALLTLLLRRPSTWGRRFRKG